MLDTALKFIDQYQQILTTIGIVSGVVFVATLLFIPYLLGLIPADHFVRPALQNRKPISILTGVKLLLKTLIGLLLLLAGIVMLVTPGQGVISIVLGLFLMQFPGKRRLERRFIQHDPTFNALNWLRSKAKKPPFER